MDSKKRISVLDIKVKKKGKPIVCLTAYTAPMAKILDEFVDILLVGDSLGMVLYGMDSTLGVNLDMMKNHGRAVVKASSNAMVAVDLPYGSYQESKQKAFRNAARIMAETGCQAVKLEGGVEMETTIEYLVARGIPVMAHVGLMPQHVNQYGGYKFQGASKEGQKKIISDAMAVERAGAFAVVVEAVAEKLAKDITKNLSIPVIGIGASPHCDGQVLVTEDMLGVGDGFTPKFVKKYASLNKEISLAVKKYSEEVRARKFPSAENVYNKF